VIADVKKDQNRYRLRD